MKGLHIKQLAVGYGRRVLLKDLELSVAPDDMGRVIGKQGKIAKAIRTVMKAVAAKNNVKVMVDII